MKNFLEDSTEPTNIKTGTNIDLGMRLGTNIDLQISFVIAHSRTFTIYYA